MGTKIGSAVPIVATYCTRLFCAVLALAASVFLIRLVGADIAGQYFALFAIGYSIAQFSKLGRETSAITAVTIPSGKDCALVLAMALGLGSLVSALVHLIGPDLGASGLVSSAIIPVTAGGVAVLELIGDSAKGVGLTHSGVLLSNGALHIFFVVALLVVGPVNLEQVAVAWISGCLACLVSAVVLAVMKRDLFSRGRNRLPEGAIRLGMVASIPFAAQALIISIVGFGIGFSGAAQLRIMTRSVSFIAFVGNALQAVYGRFVLSDRSPLLLKGVDAMIIGVCLILALVVSAAYVTAEPMLLGYKSGVAMAIFPIAIGQALLSSTALLQSRMAVLGGAKVLLNARLIGYSFAVSGAALAAVVGGMALACVAFGLGLAVQFAIIRRWGLNA